VQVGDLVTHKSNGVLGLIVEEVQSRIVDSDTLREEGALYSIRWFDAITYHHTNHWWHELEVISANR
jgi:hypothetical protein